MSDFCTGRATHPQGAKIGSGYNALPADIKVRITGRQALIF